MNKRKHAIDRRTLLGGLGLGAVLPLLEGLGGRPAQAQPSKRLKRLVIVSQAHMALGYHRIPEFCTGSYGNADASLLKLDQTLGLRVGAFGSDPGKLGSFYAQGALANTPRLQKEMMVVNGLCPTYTAAQGHISDGNGTWNAGSSSGKFNTRTRYALSASLHQPMVTIDQVIAKKIHTAGQRIMYMGNAHWGAGGADTDEAIDFNGSVQSLVGSPNDVYNGPIFDAGRKITAAMQQTGTMAPPMPADPLAGMSAQDFAALSGLQFSQSERTRVLADKRLSTNDRRTLEQYYDLLNDGLKAAQGGSTTGGGSGGTGATVAGECKPITVPSGDFAGFTKLMATAFLCDLSRVAYISMGQYHDHNTEWHAGADGDAGKVPIFVDLPKQVAQVAQMLMGLTDPATGRDMLESSIVIGITNCAMALRTDGRDTSHEYGDFSYFSVGGSAALKTGFMYDALGYNGGKRPAASGPVPTVNQYHQTIAAAFGLTSADWSPAGGKGFGPWMADNWRGRSLRVDDNAKTSAIPGLLVT